MISRVLMPNLLGYDFILGSARVARLVKVEHSRNDFGRNRNRVCGPLNATPHRQGVARSHFHTLAESVRVWPASVHG